MLLLGEIIERINEMVYLQLTQLNMSIFAYFKILVIFFCLKVFLFLFNIQNKISASKVLLQGSTLCFEY